MIEIIKDHIDYRFQIFKLAWFDLVKMYKGTVFGWIWILVKPAVTIFVFWFAFTHGMRAGAPINGVPYIVWLIAGILPWFFISDVLNSGIDCMKKNNFLVNKIKFPISVIPTFDTVSKLLPHLILLTLFTIIYIVVFGANVYLVQLPFYLLILFVYFTILTLAFSLLSILSRDFLNLVRAFTTPLFWLSGVIYPIAKLDIGWVKQLLLFNPITFFAESYRNVFVNKQWFFERPQMFVAFLLTFIFTIALSLFVYNKTKKEVGDIL